MLFVEGDATRGSRFPPKDAFPFSMRAAAHSLRHADATAAIVRTIPLGMLNDVPVAAALTLDQFETGYEASLRAFNEGNLEAAFAVLAPDCEYHTTSVLGVPLPRAHVPDPGRHEEQVLVGREAVIRLFAEELLNIMPNWTVEAVRVLEAAEGVFVVLERGRGSGRSSGAPAVLDFASVYELRGPLVVRCRQYSTWEEGLAAAGLDPALAVEAKPGPD